jgi:hypothetical protein
LDLYHTVVQVTVKEPFSFGYQGESLDLRLNQNLDHLNFTDLPAGTVIGEILEGLSECPVKACDERLQDVTADYFALQNGRLVLKKPVIPSMLTPNEPIIRQDCLCYLMENCYHRLVS